MSIRPDPFPQSKQQERISALEQTRRKDRRNLKMANAMLCGVEAMNKANTRADILDALSDALKDAIGAHEVTVIGDVAEGMFGVPQSRPTVLHPLRTQPALTPDIFDWFARHRQIKNLSVCRAPAAGLVSARSTGSLISAPFRREGGQMLVVLCWHPSVDYFDTDKAKVLDRMTVMMSHALRGIRTDDRHALLASVLENAEVPVMLADPAEQGSAVVYVNRAFEALSGRTLADAMGMQFITDRFRPGADLESMAAAFAAGQRGRYRVWNSRKNGAPFLDEISLTPIRDTFGSLRYMLATHTDVTEQAQTLEVVHQLEQRIESAMEAVSSAILATGADGEVLYANTAMHRLLHELYGTEMRPHQAIATFVKRVEDCAQNLELTCSDGAVFLIRSFDSSEGGHVITGTDVTEIKRAERELKQRAAAMDSTTEGIAIVERSARIAYANPAFARIFGAGPPSSILGRKWCDAFLAEDVARLSVEVRPKVESLGFAQIEMRAHVDGKKLTFEVCVTRIDDKMRIVVVRDITRRIEYEDARASFDKKLHDFEKNESIGRLAAGVAHDFNNLLAVINGHSALLNERTAPDKVQLYSERINAASSRAAKMINRFLDLGMSADNQSMIDLRNLMSESQDLLRSALSAETRFTLDLDDAEMEMLCYPSDLLRVALNLVQNAQDALGGRPGQIHQCLKRFAGIDLMDLPLAIGSIDPEQAYARYTVEDSGSGIPADVLGRLFHEHCSTKGQRGSGIGMMAIAEIIRSHEGAIRILSQEGHGTRVEIFLPLSDYSVTRISDEDIGSVRLDGQLILLVDDDAQVAESIAAFLERLGAEVSICLHPDEALEAIKEDPGLWSFLVTDYNMPGQNGGQLAQAAKSADGDLPIVIVTALARKLSDPNLSEDVISALLGKPVDLNTLAHLIAQHGRVLPPPQP